jgi:hypothetical protein
MPLDSPLASVDATQSEPQFFEPRLPDAKSDDWQGILRQIFATEDGLWQRRAITRPAISPRG